ncbi:hypothetical protein KIPB_013943, partial [Kipferlia bialata]
GASESLLERSSIAGFLTLLCVYITPFHIALIRPSAPVAGGDANVEKRANKARLATSIYLTLAPTLVFIANLAAFQNSGDPGTSSL